MLSKHWRGEIHKAWGNPRIVAGAAYGAWLPYAVSAHWPDLEDGTDAQLDDIYPANERAMDMAFLAIESKDSTPDDLCRKLNAKMVEVLKAAVIEDVGD
ncbi:MAG: hypothetical protein ACREGR_00655 [Minisyncoccia bacterium]